MCLTQFGELQCYFKVRVYEKCKSRMPAVMMSDKLKEAVLMFNPETVNRQPIYERNLCVVKRPVLEIQKGFPHRYRASNGARFSHVSFIV